LGDSDQLDLDLPGVGGGNWNPILKEENPRVVQLNFAPGSLRDTRRRYQSSIAGSAASARQRRDRSLQRMVEELELEKFRLDRFCSQLRDYENASDGYLDENDNLYYYKPREILR
jgi:hypothetical protein